MGGVPILKDVAWLAMGRLIASGLQALMFVILARNAGPTHFGLVAASLGATAFLQAGLDFGLSVFIVKERARKRDSRWVGRGLKAYNCTNFILGAVVFLAILAAGLVVSADMLLLLPLCLWASFERSSDAWMGVAIADGDTHLNSYILVGRRVLTLGLYLALSHMQVADLLAYSSSTAISAGVSMLCAHKIIAARVEFRTGRIHFRRMLAVSRPYWINSIGAQLRNLDSTLVAVLSGPVQAGLYGSAARIATPLALLASSMGGVLLPRATRATPVMLRTLIRIAALLIGVSAFFYIGLAALADVVYPLLFGAEFASGSTVFRYVILSVIFSSASIVISALLQARNEHAFVARTSVTISAVFVAGVIPAALYHGALGAALMLLGSACVQSVILCSRIVKVVRRLN